MHVVVKDAGDRQRLTDFGIGFGLPELRRRLTRDVAGAGDYRLRAIDGTLGLGLAVRGDRLLRIRRSASLRGLRTRQIAFFDDLVYAESNVYVLVLADRRRRDNRDRRSGFLRVYGVGWYVTGW